MFLTDYQKELIDKFEEGIIFDIYSFLQSLDEIKLINYFGQKLTFTLENFNEKVTENVTVPDKVYTFGTEDFDKIKRKTFEFLFVCTFLENQGLLRSIRLSPGGSCIFIPVVDEKDKGHVIFDSINNVISQIAFEGYKWRYEISPKVKEFVKRGYLSDEEYRHKQSNKWTKILAGIAFLGIIANTIVQVAYSGKERDVNLNNKNAFPETTKVMLINPQNSKIDTLTNIIKK